MHDFLNDPRFVGIEKFSQKVWLSSPTMHGEEQYWVPLVLKVSTKKKLEQKTPEEIEQIMSAAIEEINHGCITPLDELINRRL